VTSFLTSSHEHSDSDLCSAHVSTLVGGRGTYGPFLPGNPYLLQSTQERNFSAFEFESHCLFQDVANSSVRDHFTAHQLMDCTYIRRRGYRDATWHRTDRNVGNDHVPKIRPGWTTCGALLLRYLLLLQLEAELSISKFFSHLRASKLHCLP